MLRITNKGVTRGVTRTSLRSFSVSNMAAAHAEDDVLFSNRDLARVVTLNRPKKLNSLNTLMVLKIAPRLVEYSKSSVANMVLLNSNSPKGLCAGGDVAECASQIKNESNPGYASDFFQQEYNLNYLIATYPKPYVSFMDGITMGGGVGLSVHGPFRIATERTKLAMPEMDIGFFPDVGTTFFLPRLDDNLGRFYAMTGKVMSGVEAYYAGFATHYVTSDRLDQLATRLANLQPPALNDQKPADNHSSTVSSQREFFAQVNSAIEEFAATSIDENPLTVEQQKTIKNAFSKNTVEEILALLDQDGSDFALQTKKTLMTKSPTSLKVALELMIRGAENTIRAQLELEMIAATNIMHLKPEQNDFVLGVSHKLIDKVKEPAFPNWYKHPNVSEISKEHVEKLLDSSIHTAKLNHPLLQKFFGVNYKEYPHHMGLPSAKQVEDYVTGNDGSNRSYLPTPAEVVKHFQRATNNKVKKKKKVERILAIHGESSKYDNKYVSWVK